MDKQQEFVLRTLEERDIRFVRLWFTDVLGFLKSVAVAPAELVLVETDAPVAVASAIWPHGRWRFDVTGEGNHAGTTRMADRRDPMLTYAFTVLAANKEARLRGAHATVGRVAVEPNATNAIPSNAGWRSHLCLLP